MMVRCGALLLMMAATVAAADIQTPPWESRHPLAAIYSRELRGLP